MFSTIRSQTQRLLGKKLAKTVEESKSNVVVDSVFEMADVLALHIVSLAVVE